MNEIRDGGAALKQRQNHMLDFDKLVEQVQSLPQELFDKIYDLTFTSESQRMPDPVWDARCVERSSHMLPSTLQVSRATRAAFAETFYGEGTTFYVSWEAVGAWISPLASEHVSLLEDVRISDFMFPGVGPRCALEENYDEDEFKGITDVVSMYPGLTHVISIRVEYENNEIAWKKLDEVENGFWDAGDPY